MNFNDAILTFVFYLVVPHCLVFLTLQVSLVVRVNPKIKYFFSNEDTEKTYIFQ